MNPYEQLGREAFWKTAVADRSMFDVSGLWQPKFRISPRDRVVTFGSCFAQHIGKALANRGFNWHITEKPPRRLDEMGCERFNYNVFSCRTGNIYTTSLLRQWTEWALGKSVPPDEVWKKNGRYVDPFRPRIEPDGFASAGEMEFVRDAAISSFEQCIKEADYFVFTLGLTESWFHFDGYEYPMCPGTVAGEFSEAQHRFVNQQFAGVMKNLNSAINLMRSVNANLRFILTVSPVPLTATNSGSHVLVATMNSKSVLRAVAGQLAENQPYIDYFPSYEIINSSVFKGAFFEPNQRSVNPKGVEFVMDQFFECQRLTFGSVPQGKPSKEKLRTDSNDSDPFCDEALLEVFGHG